jgi:hypothetical protein
MSYHKVQFYAPFNRRLTAKEVAGGDEIPLYYPDCNAYEQYIKQPYIADFREYVKKVNSSGLAKPVIEFTDIDVSRPYNGEEIEDRSNFNVFNWFLHSNDGIHQGQRKLLDSEVQAMNKTFTSYDEAGIVIYAGSAPSMKLWTMMKMYPNVIFLLVDPNEFFIYVHRYDLPHYVFQDEAYVKDGEKWGGPSSQEERAEESTSCVYLSASSSNMYDSRFYKKKNILHYDTDSESVIKMKKPTTNSAYGTGQRRLNTHVGEYPMLTRRANHKSIEYVFQSVGTNSTRVFFIEEYFTNNIAEMIGEVGAKYPGIKTTFWSDIRTNMGLKDYPTDMDILLNTAWMYSWLRRMKPTTSMLKWKLPFFNESTEIDFSEFEESFADAAEKGCDFRIPTWKNDKIMFFPGRIMLQAWCGPYSTETRLIVDREDIVNNNLIEYSISEYESKMNAYNNIRRYGVLSENSNANPEIGFDHCNDCAIENSIWEEYKQRNPSCDIVKLMSQISTILNINLLNRKGRFGHGSLFPDMKMADFIKKVSESRYPPISSIRR